MPPVPRDFGKLRTVRRSPRVSPMAEATARTSAQARPARPTRAASVDLAYARRVQVFKKYPLDLLRQLASHAGLKGSSKLVLATALASKKDLPCQRTAVRDLLRSSAQGNSATHQPQPAPDSSTAAPHQDGKHSAQSAAGPTLEDRKRISASSSSSAQGAFGGAQETEEVPSLVESPRESKSAAASRDLLDTCMFCGTDFDASEVECPNCLEPQTSDHDYDPCRYPVRIKPRSMTAGQTPQDITGTQHPSPGVGSASSSSSSSSSSANTGASPPNASSPFGPPLAPTPASGQRWIDRIPGLAEALAPLLSSTAPTPPGMLRLFDYPPGNPNFASPHGFLAPFGLGAPRQPPSSSSASSSAALPSFSNSSSSATNFGEFFEPDTVLRADELARIGEGSYVPLERFVDVDLTSPPAEATTLATSGDAVVQLKSSRKPVIKSIGALTAAFLRWSRQYLKYFPTAASDHQQFLLSLLDWSKTWPLNLLVYYTVHLLRRRCTNTQHSLLPLTKPDEHLLASITNARLAATQGQNVCFRCWQAGHSHQQCDVPVAPARPTPITDPGKQPSPQRAPFLAGGGRGKAAPAITSPLQFPCHRWNQRGWCNGPCKYAHRCELCSSRQHPASRCPTRSTTVVTGQADGQPSPSGAAGAKPTGKTPKPRPAAQH